MSGRLDKVSSSGITTSYTYNTKGNATNSKTEKAVPKSGGKFYIQNVKTGSYVSVAGGGSASGTNVIPAAYEGSVWESGYVYAWKTKPGKYAIKNSGAHMGVTISYKTNASFVMYTGIRDPKVQMYGPVVSTMPGPIVVWDVQIVG